MNFSIGLYFYSDDISNARSYISLELKGFFEFVAAKTKFS